jgi:hypothetical protein
VPAPADPRVFFEQGPCPAQELVGEAVLVAGEVPEADLQQRVAARLGPREHFLGDLVPFQCMASMWTGHSGPILKGGGPGLDGVRVGVLQSVTSASA